MSRSKKRKPDLRRIRTTKTYTVPEIAMVLSRSIATVRRWIRDGLPILDNNHPTLVDGAVLRQWLQKKWEAKCADNELYCFKCRKPRMAMLGTARVGPRNAKMITINANCEVCGNRMNRGASAADLMKINITFEAFMEQKQRLLEYGDTCVKRTYSQRTR